MDSCGLYGLCVFCGKFGNITKQNITAYDKQSNKPIMYVSICSNEQCLRYYDAETNRCVVPLGTKMYRVAVSTCGDEWYWDICSNCGRVDDMLSRPVLISQAEFDQLVDEFEMAQDSRGTYVLNKFVDEGHQYLNELLNSRPPLLVCFDCRDEFGREICIEYDWFMIKKELKKNSA